MALGYLGHVASHGMDWEAPSTKLAALMNGDPDWQKLADALRIRYLFWGHNEEETYENSLQPWKQSTRLVASGDWGAIYDLRFAPASAAGPPAE